MKLFVRTQLLAIFLGLNVKAQSFNLNDLFGQFGNIGGQQAGGSTSSNANVAQSNGISQQNSQSTSSTFEISNPMAAPTPTPTPVASTDQLFILPAQSFTTDPQSIVPFVSSAISTAQALNFEASTSGFNPVSTSEPVLTLSSADSSQILSSGLPVATSNIGSMPTAGSTLTQSSAVTVSSSQSSSFATTPTFNPESISESVTSTGSASSGLPVFSASSMATSAIRTSTSGLPVFSASSMTTSTIRPSSSPTTTTSSTQPSPTPENKNEVYLAAVSILNTIGNMVNSFDISQGIKDATNAIIKNLATIIANFFK